MKLWVRTQDKKRLLEVNDFYIEDTFEADVKNKKLLPLGFGIWTNNKLLLASYPTKERCLEIIDEIQELLNLGNPENAFMHLHNCDMGYDETLEVLKRARETKAIITQGAEFDIKLPSVVVYEMPEK